jgi:hypothetical protein
MSFDYNIDNYTRDELIQMLELPNGFDANIVEMKESKLRDSIINNRNIDKDTQTNIINFLTKAKNHILNGILGVEQKIENLNNILTKSYNTNFKLSTTDVVDNNDHMVQKRKENNFLSSYPSEFFPGVVNPLKKRTLKKNLNIDTRFRDNYYNSSSTNFNLTLPIVFNDVIQMQMSNIELPTTYYVVSKQYGNNFFTIEVNGSSLVINISDGNYTQNTIMKAINNELVMAGAPFDQVSFIINLADGNTGSGQTMVGFINLTGNTSIKLNFQADKYGNYDTGTPLPLKFGWLLGFRNGVYADNLNYVSEGVLDITGPKYFFLVVDDYNNSVNNSFYSAFNSSILNKNILARISLQSSVFNILEQNNLSIVTIPREYFGPVNIQNINIQLLDEYGRVVDLNNMDYSFCVTLTSIYDI